MRDAFGVERSDISKSAANKTRAIFRAGKTAKEAGKKAKQYEAIEQKYAGDYVTYALNRAVKPELSRKLGVNVRRNAATAQAASRRKVRYQKLQRKAKTTRNARNAVLGVTGITAGGATLQKRKDKPEMPDEKLARRKQLSAGTTIVSSTLGIAGLTGLLGAKGLPRAAAKAAKSKRVLAKLPKKTKVFVADPKRVRAAEKKGTNIA